MMPELGNFLLCLAAGLALLLSVYPLWGAARQDRRLMVLARPLACGLFACIGGAFLLLVHAFVVNDFTVRYVAENSNSALPVWYRVAATWGAHEGSLLLWVLLLSVWTFAVALFSRRMPLDAVARVLAVMGMIAFGFLLFILFTSNPFSRGLPQYPIDGRDLNPLLQDIGMIFHPPILYMGYVGFSVAFAFAIASLLAGLAVLCLAAALVWFARPQPETAAPRYLLKDSGGHVALYTADGIGPLATYDDLYTRLLPESDVLALQQGVFVADEAELQRRLEDYGL